MAVSAGGRRCGRSGSGTRNEFNGRQESSRVSLGSLGHRPDDPGITALFLGLAQQTAAPPDGRMPPVKSADDQLEPAHPVIAPLQVRQLVQQERRPLVEARRRPELRRHQQPGPAADRPEHRRHPAGHQAKRRSLGQSPADPASSAVRACHSSGAGSISFINRWKRMIRTNARAHQATAPDSTTASTRCSQLQPAGRLMPMFQRRAGMASPAPRRTLGRTSQRESDQASSQDFLLDGRSASPTVHRTACRREVLAHLGRGD